MRLADQSGVVQHLLLTLIYGVISWVVFTEFSMIVMRQGIVQGWRTVFALGGAWGMFMGVQLPDLAETLANEYRSAE